MMPHPDLMFDALVIWAALYLVVALGLWYATRRKRYVAGNVETQETAGSQEGRWRPNWRSMASWLLEQLDDLYVMEWMDRTGWAGRIAKIVVIAFVASPLWILGSLWLLLMGRFIGVVFHLFGKVYY